MSAITHRPLRALSGHSHIGGLSLLELMVALALGLLLSAGILSLFSSTSQTNKLQNGLARLQENGRFAVTRMESDLRMMAGQYCSNFAGGGQTGSVPMVPQRSPDVFAANLGFPDSGPDAGNGSLDVMNSVDAEGYPSADAASAAWTMSPRYFVQGYSCPTNTDCTTGLPEGIPDQGLEVGNRVPASDVLTVRYQRGSGWPIQPSATAACSSGGTLTLASHQPGDDTLNLAAGDLAIVSDCQNVSILPVDGVAGNTITLGTLLTAPGKIATCSNPGNRDMRLFNFTDDFVTVTYFLQFQADDSPDARPNSAAAQRLVPSLMRRENGADAQELVRGVDQLRFRYGVQQPTGNTRFLSADDLNGVTPCTAQQPGVPTEPGCLWRSVRMVEARLLVNTVDEVFGLDGSSREYSFDDAPPVTTTDAGELPSGVRAGSMLRREFIAYTSNRNYNF